MRKKLNLKPWLSRHIPAMSKSTATKLRGEMINGLAVDHLPPMPVDDLLQGVQQDPATSTPHLHPDLVPPPQAPVESFILTRAEFEPILDDSPTVSKQTQPNATGQLLEQDDSQTVSTEGEKAQKDQPEILGFEFDLPPSPHDVVLAPKNDIHNELPPAPLMPPSVVPPIRDGSDKQNRTEYLKSAPKLLDLEERSAYMRAVNLFQKLKRVGYGGRREAINRLFDIVAAFPHGASVVSIGNMLDAGCELHEVEDAAALKEYWRSDSSLWLRRYLGSRELFSDSRHQTHLSWVAAHAITSAMGREQAIDAIQGILMHEWLTMARDAYSGSTFEFCFYHHFILKRAHDIQAGSMNPILQVFEESNCGDLVMPFYIEVRSTAPHFNGKVWEKVFLPSIQNIDSKRATFSRQTKQEKKISQEAMGSTDA